MKNFLQFILFIFLSKFSVNSAQSIDSVYVAFYNLENLFDTINDPNTQDDEYLPYGIKGWNSARYWRKVHQMSRVISAMNNWEGPDVIGLCEVENRVVLNDLINSSALQSKGYGIVHNHSEDNRGIDVCLLYKKNKVKLLSYEYLRVKDSVLIRPTRDILYASFLVGEDTLHCFYNHWPSRFGGAAVSNPKRIVVARRLIDWIAKLGLNFTRSNVVIMGDFNDGPNDESTHELSDAGFTYVNTLNDLPGTHKYQSEWNTFDQIWVSKMIRHVRARTFTPNWVLMEDEKYSGVKMYRTYNGPNYLGGYSDHLAIYLHVDLQ